MCLCGGIYRLILFVISRPSLFICELSRGGQITRALFDEQIKVLKEEEGKRLNAALMSAFGGLVLMFAFGGLVVYIVMRR